MLQAGGDMTTKSGRIPGLARHTNDLQTIRERASGAKLDESGE
jgi:hypothetical protein